MAEKVVAATDAIVSQFPKSRLVPLRLLVCEDQLLEEEDEIDDDDDDSMSRNMMSVAQ